jgi:DNA-binding GntR family transcriptional regulator
MPLPSHIGRLARERAGNLVYERLRGWILHGPLQPEESIRDAEIALALGVSRTPVREALLRLEHEGLVQTASGRWTRVAPLRLAQAPDLYRTVAVLDALAAEQATLLLTDGDIAALAKANERLLRQTSGDAIHRADHEFHGIYRSVASNDVVTTILDSVGADIDRIERAYFSDPAVPEESYRSHGSIIAAFRARDAREAAAAARTNWLASLPRVEALAAEAVARRAATNAS